MALYSYRKGAWGSSDHRLTRADSDTFRLEYREESNTGRNPYYGRTMRQYMTREQALTWGDARGYSAEQIDALEVESCGF